MEPSSGPGRFISSAATGNAAVSAVRQTQFDRWAPHYDHSPLQRTLYEPVHRKVLENARRRVPAPKRILDVGCGTGRLTRLCSAYFPGVPVIGIDPCAEMINQAAASKAPATRWLQARAEALPFGNGVFSLVVSTLSLRHWQNPHQGLAEISRITTPDGTIMIADARIADALPPPPTPPRAAPRFMPCLSTRPRRRGAGRISAGGPYALERAGLHVVHVEPIVLALATVTLIIAGNSAARPG